ncbi:MAG: acylphosphatase [Bacteroidetes bacterium]|nr:MAG: acylphosphatase [Bacteroidota bacterium]
MEENIRAELIVEGLVQGVGFRYYVYQHAVTLGLKGYVKNRWDGTVYVIAEGEKSSIELMKNYLQKGPMMSHVEKVIANYSNITNDYTEFEIR